MKKGSKMDFTKIVKTDLDFSRRELSNDGLGFVIALPFFLGIYFPCACTGKSIQLYAKQDTTSSPTPRWLAPNLSRWTISKLDASPFILYQKILRRRMAEPRLSTNSTCASTYNGSQSLEISLDKVVKRFLLVADSCQRMELERDIGKFWSILSDSALSLCDTITKANFQEDTAKIAEISQWPCIAHQFNCANIRDIMYRHLGHWTFKRAE